MTRFAITQVLNRFGNAEANKVTQRQRNDVSSRYPAGRETVGIFRIVFVQKKLLARARSHFRDVLYAVFYPCIGMPLEGLMGSGLRSRIILHNDNEALDDFVFRDECFTRNDSEDLYLLW